MIVTDLRQRLVARVDEAAEGGDEMAIATVLAFSRAVLIALARQPADGEVDMEDLEVGTATAATILGLHPEYVRFLVRHDKLTATKENGELRILLSDIVALLRELGKLGELGKTPFQSTLGDLVKFPYMESKAEAAGPR